MGEIIKVDGIKVPIGSHEGKKIILGADHRGFLLKKQLIKFLKSREYEIADIGTFSEARCDYPELAFKLGKTVAQDSSFSTVGIGICGTGIGMSVAAKIPGIIASRCLSPDDAAISRKHNNSNVLCLSADKTTAEEAINIVETWLREPFYKDKSDEAYLRRYLQTRKLESY